MTPPLDGTILPGVTCTSVLSLLSHRPLSASLPQLPPTLRLLCSISVWCPAQGFLRWHTAAVVIPAARIGWQCSDNSNGGSAGGGTTEEGEVKVQAADVWDIVLPVVGGEGSIAQVLWERFVDI